MIVSKISRSLVVVIFVASIIFLGILDFRALTSESVVSNYSNVTKLIYGVVVIALVLLYIYIKDKLYKKKIKRNIGLIFRYIYVSIIIVISKLLILKLQNINLLKSELIVYILVSYVLGIVIKKIVFNVSKSDMLSVFGTFAYSLLPVISEIENKNIIISTIYSLIIFSTILAIQILIDELKQRGMKTKKYAVEACITGLLIGLSLFFGTNIIIWVIFALGILLIAYNLDNTHINFPKKVMAGITQTQRENLYKIERINISKLLVSLVIICIVSTLMFFGGKFVINKINTNQNYYVQTISNNINLSNNFNKNTNFDIHTLTNTYKNFINYSKTYYMLLFIYIIFMEILAVALKRRYDTKSTVMKLLFLLILNMISIYSCNLILYQNALTIFLILIAIVNTSNIYLNREERIKMLVA